MNKTFYALCACGFLFSGGMGADCCSNVSANCKDFISAVREMQQGPGAEKLAEHPWFNWKNKGSCNVVYSSKHYVSFKIHEWSYTGGAHGRTQTTFCTLKGVKRLKLADLYRLPREKKQLENLWKAAIARHFKKTFEERLKEAGEVFKPLMTENFYLDDKGIHFIYDPYDIDCYAAGTIDIFVPWKMPR